jgi:NAD-dependent SIR2 family protein deacetylase
MTCQSKVDSTYILQQTMQMDTIVPKCSSSKRKLHPKKRSIITTNGSAIHRAKRSSTLSTSSTATNDTDLCNGVMKPCITFFGEKLHSNVNRFLQADQKKVDALIVIGTSLSV